jgi:hypothetical protein
MPDQNNILVNQLEALDLDLDVLAQHVEIIDRKIDTLEARFARIERKLDALIEPAGTWISDRRTS